MSHYQLFGILAGVLSIFDFFIYSISILKNKTRPSRVTWLILTIVGVIIFSSYYALGARETIWVALGYTLGPFIIFLLSIKYGEGGWTRFDRFCLLGALISIVLWWKTGSAFIALIINIIIDFFGILPTIKKSYLNPKSEDSFPWLITFITCIVNIFAIESWRFDIWVYPIYLLLSNGVIAFFLYFPKSQSSK